jgi:hypothetical protein
MKPDDASTAPADPGPEDPAGTEAATPETLSATPGGAERPGNMLPRRGRRRLGVERLLVRLIATCGIVGIGVLLGAILVSQKVAGWIDGLVIAGVTVVLAALLWSSRQL